MTTLRFQFGFMVTCACPPHPVMFEVEDGFQSPAMSAKVWQQVHNSTPGLLELLVSCLGTTIGKIHSVAMGELLVVFCELKVWALYSTLIIEFHRIVTRNLGSVKRHSGRWILSPIIYGSTSYLMLILCILWCEWTGTMLLCLVQTLMVLLFHKKVHFVSSFWANLAFKAIGVRSLN